MKPPRFDYLPAGSVDEALAALAEPGSVVLAGGQSLLLELAYRQRRPRLLVDINRLDELHRLAAGEGTVRIGALVRHRDLEQDDGSGPVRRLLAKAAPYVAHPPIRNRGTFAGSLAWAHPAAEWHAVALACDARITMQTARGSRQVSVGDWYLGPYRSAAGPDELITEVELAAPARAGAGFAEHRRTHASFADVAVAALVSVEHGAVRAARIGIVGAADTPFRATDAELAIVDSSPAAAAGHAAAALHSGVAGYRAALARELTRRAVAEAVRER